MPLAPNPDKHLQAMTVTLHLLKHDPAPTAKAVVDFGDPSLTIAAEQEMTMTVEGDEVSFTHANFQKVMKKNNQVGKITFTIVEGWDLTALALATGQDPDTDIDNGTMSATHDKIAVRWHMLLKSPKGFSILAQDVDFSGSELPKMGSGTDGKMTLTATCTPNVDLSPTVWQFIDPPPAP